MSSTARTLVAPEPAAIDRRTWTAIEIVRPAIVLLRARPTLDVLLAKHSVEPDEEDKVTHLQGVRLIQLPLGRALAWLRFRGRFRAVRLPDEFLYSHVRLRPARLTHRAEAVFDGMSVSLAESEEPFDIELLTQDEFLALGRCRGRVLIAKVRERFAHLPLVPDAPAEPSWLRVLGDLLTADLRLLLRRAWRRT